MALSAVDAATRATQAAQAAAEVTRELAARTDAPIIVRDANNTATEALTKVTGLATAVRGDPGLLGQDRRIADAYDAAAQALKAAVVAMTGQDSSVLDEWKECRQTIDRFDKLLVDLRKVGFSFITAIVSAATFFFTHIPTVPLAPAPQPGTPIPGLPTYPISDPAKAVVFGVIVVMIVLLFMIDRTHQLWLFTAVSRAKALEQTLGYRITTALGERFSEAKALTVVWALYVMLLIAVIAAAYVSFTNPRFVIPIIILTVVLVLGDILVMHVKWR